MKQARIVVCAAALFTFVAGIHGQWQQWPMTTPRAAEAHHAPVEGFGAKTKGGAGQPECVVTSRADSGPGSLRQCLATGNRHVKFAVAGTITLEEPIRLGGSFVTIDGFTAPSPGITLKGWGLEIFDVNDIVVRGLRIREAGVGFKSDCIQVFGGGAFNIVVDHVSIYKCGDGGIDVSGGPKDVTIQWSIVSTVKTMLMGSTSSLSRRDTDRISLHHTALICGPVATLGCDRMPLVRASEYPVRVDIRNSIMQGWLRANGTKLEAAAEVNVVGNAYIPRPETSDEYRDASLAVGTGTRVYTADNIELGASPRPDLNDNGNESAPLPAPPVTMRGLGCVLRDAGTLPHDAVDRNLLTYVDVVPSTCGDSGTPLPTDPAPAPQPDLAPRTVSAPGTVAPGETVEVAATIANNGAAAAASSMARVYLSSDSALGSGDLALGSMSVPSLAAGATVTRAATMTVPSTTDAGTYRLLVKADDTGVVAESNETNNVLASLVTIGSSTPSPIPALIEAESMTRTAGMTVGSDPAALGGAYISPTGGSNSLSPVREASATVTVPEAGTYYLWARMYGPSKSADALYVGIDSSWSRVYPAETGTWQWLRIPTATGSSSAGFSLSAGVHAIQVGRGEIGTRIDAVYLTASATDTPPTSTTPPEPTLPALVQAESMSLTGGMTIGSEPAALGGAYVSPTSGGNSLRPVREASATVTVPSAGTYYLWARMYGPNKGADALYVGINSSWARVYPPSVGTWQWVRVPASGSTGFALSGGSHTIQVGRGEKDTRIDAVYLTGSAGDVPSFGAGSSTAFTTQ